MNPSLKTGCCGFPLKKPDYAAKFSVVEVQQTFYQPPRVSTLEKWRALVPDNFEFAIKAWQLITHSAKSPTYRRLKEKLSPADLSQCGSFQSTELVRKAWKTTLECAEALRARLILFQCPASFSPTDQNIDNLRKFFRQAPCKGYTLLWEPRGTWNDDIIRKLCTELNLIHAVDPFVSQSVTAEMRYLRLHGGKGFRHVFTDQELAHILRAASEAPEAYVMFNNMAMLNDAIRFKAMAGALAS